MLVFGVAVAFLILGPSFYVTGNPHPSVEGCQKLSLGPTPKKAISGTRLYPMYPMTPTKALKPQEKPQM